MKRVANVGPGLAVPRQHVEPITDVDPIGLVVGLDAELQDPESPQE
jgi:hypothetical protein